MPAQCWQASHQAVHECHIIVNFGVKDISQGELVPVHPVVLEHWLGAGESVAKLSIGLYVLFPIPNVVLGYFGAWESTA